MTPGETIPVLKEALVELTEAERFEDFDVRRRDHEFIQDVDVLPANNASVDLGRCVLRLGREVSLWRSGARPPSSRLTLASKEVILARCERVVTTRLEVTLEAANVEPIKVST
jgi:hypothetical protein